jgi:glycerophosphoryl diester phosphodiesterase
VDERLRIFKWITLSIFLLTWLLAGCSQTAPGGEEGPMNAEDKPVMVIAHRGARSLAPENTLAAGEKALALGADGWELDVAMSADGVLFLLHDDTLERTTNAAQVFPDRGPWAFHQFTMDELRQLDFGSWFVESDPFQQGAEGNISPADLEAFRGLPPTTLEEALRFTKENRWWVNVEIKDASGTPADAVIVPKVVELIEALEMEEQVLISSFNWEYLHQVRAINSTIATGVLTNRVVVDPLREMRTLDAQAYHPGRNVTHAQQVQALLAEGYDVNVWTVNDPAEMQALIEMGVTGIITDFPQLERNGR